MDVYRHRPQTAPPDSADTPADTDVLLEQTARHIVSGESVDAFLGWFDAEAARLAPAFNAWSERVHGQPLTRGIGLALWSLLPRLGISAQPTPLDALVADAPCPCGSSRTHDQCCRLSRALAAMLAGLPLLRHTIEAIPDEAMSRAELHSVDAEALQWALEQLADDAQGERIVHLIAPVFETNLSAETRASGKAHASASGETLASAETQASSETRPAAEATGARAQSMSLHQHVGLLDVLLDSWPRQYARARLDQLLEQLADHPQDDIVRLAWLRRIRLLALEQPDRVWPALHAARSRLPAHREFDEAEIDLLNAAGRLDEAVELARKVGDAERQRQPQDGASPGEDPAEELLARAIRVDPETALEQDRHSDDVLDRLLVLLDETPAAPTAGSHAGVDEARELKLIPSALLARVENNWQETFGVTPALNDKPAKKEDRDNIDGDDRMTQVVSFLDDEPLALSSFRVLDALAGGAGGWDHERWADALHVRVLERAEVLLYRHVVHESGFETPEGEPDWDSMVWENAPRVSSDHPANREALDLLNGLIQFHRSTPDTEDNRFATLAAAARGLGRARPLGRPLF